MKTTLKKDMPLAHLARTPGCPGPNGACTSSKELRRVMVLLRFCECDAAAEIFCHSGCISKRSLGTSSSALSSCTGLLEDIAGEKSCILRKALLTEGRCLPWRFVR